MFSCISCKKYRKKSLRTVVEEKIEFAEVTNRDLVCITSNEWRYLPVNLNPSHVVG